jgi:glutamate/tyrosine decarboxylase-like PLP-dependent enzyme
LNVSYDSGLAGVRDGEALRGAFAMRAPYLLMGEAREPMDYTAESSRRARGTEVWAALHSLGRQGVADQVERCCAQARRFGAALSDAGCDVRNDVVLNQVLVSFGDDARTRRVIEAIQREGTCWCGEGVWRGRASMRISVSSWATTEQDVERSLEAILRCNAATD